MRTAFRRLHLRRSGSRLTESVRHSSCGSVTCVDARVGATLTEVLMAILIMGVGVVSVFTLFPISVLRTIQATNQTNAKFLKENTEEQVAQSPIFLTALTPSGNAAPASPIAGLNYRATWAPQTDYDVNDVVVASVKPGGVLPQPLEWFICTVTSDPNTSNPDGTSDLLEPQWNTAGPTIETEVQWEPASTVFPTIPVVGARYVVDPLGLTTAAADGQSAFIVDTFGNRTSTATGLAAALPAPLLRIHGSLSTPSQAVDFCTHPDSWQQVIEATPFNVAVDSVTFPPTVDLSGISGTALVAPRVVLTSSDGRQTAVRRLTSITTPTASWSAVTDPLPAGFPLADVGLARIEIFNRRYSWFLTVRNVGAQPEIKCIVTFNRGFNTTEEHAYAANFGNPNIDVDGDMNADSTQGLTSANQVMIAWQPTGAAGFDPEGTGDVTFEPDPLLKAGNWLFDARDASWYRIQSLDNASNASATPQWAVLSLDRTVRIITPDDATGPPAAATPIGRAILMPGIIEIFDL